MRPSNKQRSRNKPGNGGGHNSNINNNNQRRPMGNIINRVFESAGPDGKVRGTPQQIIDKYQALARDAQVSGDRVAAENYLQHSEHYSRLLGEAQRQQQEPRFGGPDREDGDRGDDQPETPQRQQPAMSAPVASGLTMIETEDGDYSGGPIETPESRRAPVPEPSPVPQAAPAAADPVNGAEHPDAPGPAEAAAPDAPKRGRPRRRAKPEGGETAPVQAD